MVAASSVNKTVPIGPRGTAQAARVGVGMAFQACSGDKIGVGIGP